MSLERGIGLLGWLPGSHDYARLLQAEVRILPSSFPDVVCRKPLSHILSKATRLALAKALMTERGGQVSPKPYGAACKRGP
jgi:hypothetical protein